MTTLGETLAQSVAANLQSQKLRIAVIDVAHIFRTAWHSTAELPLSEAYGRTISEVYKIRDGGQYDHIICAIDMPPYLRKEAYPEYKANRPRNDPAMIGQEKRTHAELHKRGFPIVGSKGYEADDICATLVDQALQDGHEIDVVTNDKDLFQLVRKGCDVVSSKSGDRFGPHEVTQLMGVPPEQVPDLLAMMGDKSDNIPGARGVGKKTAKDLLARYGTLINILQEAQDGYVDGVRANVQRSLSEDHEAILAGRVLIELATDVPIDLYEVLVSTPKKEEAPVGYEDEERGAIEGEPVLDEGQPSEAGEPAEAETRGNDSLVGGALARQAGPSVARAVPRDVVPEVHALTPSAAENAAIAEMNAIELRPGVLMTASKAKLMKAMANDFNSSGLYSRKFQNAAAIFAVMELGLELGISPQVACQNFHVIEGKPSPSAHFLIAMAKRDTDCIFLECSEESSTSVTYVTKKRSFGREQSFTYTMEDARSDGHRWAGGGKNARAMLRKTAGSQAARLWYPGPCSGLYSVEELGFDLNEEAA